MQHLPSNARGVLFLASTAAQNIGRQGSITILDREPSPLLPPMFSITRVGSANVIRALVERVHVQDSEDPDPSERYVYTKDAKIKSCLQMRDAANCDVAHINIGKEDWLQKLISKGRVKDVTKQMERAQGKFRIGPVGGFIKGARYSIKVRDANFGGYANQINVIIDDPLVPLAKDSFRIDLSDGPTRKMVSVPRGGICSAMEPVAAQDVRYVVPSRYIQYRESLVYLTEQKYLPGGIAPYGAQPGQFLPWAYRDSMCSSVPFGGSIVGVGQELVYSYCDDKGKKLVSSFVRGKVGLLEMGDQLYVTPEVEVKFDNAKAAACNTEGFLDQAIKANDAQVIEQQICQISDRSEIDQQTVAHTLRILAPFMQSQRGITRQCALNAVLSLYAEVAVDNRNVVPVSPGDKGVNAPDTERLWKDTAYAQAILNALIKAMFGQDAEARHASIEAFGRFVQLIWLTSDKLHIDSGENSALFKQTLQATQSILADKDQSEHFNALRVLANLGPRAYSMLPTLLGMVPMANSSTLGLDEALVAIAPDDPRVFDAVVVLMNQGNSFAAQHLVQIGQHRPQAVVSAILAAMKKDDNSNWNLIEALGSMGAEAKQAKPKLLKLAQSSASGVTRDDALKALVAIDDRSPETLSLICNMLQHPGFARKDEVGLEMDRRSDMFDLIAKFGVKGQAALPIVKKVMTGKITSNEKNSLERVFQELQLSEAEKARWLIMLDKVPMKQ